MSLRAKGLALLPELRALIAAGDLTRAHARATAELSDSYFMPMDIDACEDMLARMHGVPGYHLVARTLIGEGPKGKDERSVWTGAVYQSQLRRYRATGFIIGLAVKPGANECPRCDDVVGCWRIETAPEIPNPRCAGEVCCTLHWNTILKDEQPATPWRN